MNRQKIIFIQMLCAIFLLSGCSLFNVNKKTTEVDNKLSEASVELNEVVDVASSTTSESLVEEGIVVSGGSGKLLGDEIKKVINIIPAVEYKKQDGGTQDKALLDLAKENNITLDGDDIPSGLDKDTVLEIKMLSIIGSLKFMPSGDVAYLEMAKGITSWDIYKGVVFFYKPYEMKYFIYPDIDAASFESLGPAITSLPGIYFKDKNYLYKSQDDILKKVSGIDGGSFVYHYLDGVVYDEIVYGTDKNGVYIFEENGELSKLESADPDSFEQIDHSFFRDNLHVWSYSMDNKQFNLIAGADPFTFKKNKFLHGAYYTDKNNAYYYDEKIGIFKKIDGLNFTDFEIQYGTILKDENGLYYFGPYTSSLVKVSDKNYLENFRSDLFYKIDGVLYFYNPYRLSLNKLDFIDPDSFSVLFLGYQKILLRDKNNIYETDADYNIKLLDNIKDIDIASFEFLDEIYGMFVAKDLNNVYVGKNNLSVLEGADPETFKVVKYNGVIYYGVDKDRVYFVDRKNWVPMVLQDTDPETFKVHGPYLNWFYYFTDKDHTWFYDNDTDVMRNIDGVYSANFEQHARNYFNN